MIKIGVTIHYRFARDETPEPLLKKVEEAATKLDMKIEHRSWNHIVINPHPNSEWIELHWHKVKSVKARKDEGWNYDLSTLEKFGEVDDETWYCSGFTKTHYAGVDTHIKVAELLKYVGAHCWKTEVHDEAGYYESGMTEETVEKLKSFWDDYNKNIALFAAQLKEAFGKENVITGGDF